MEQLSSEIITEISIILISVERVLIIMTNQKDKEFTEDSYTISSN